MIFNCETDVFVFGSNLAGIHGAGAAKFAKERRGAVMGIGEGHQGCSYALPTKNAKIKTLPIIMINQHVDTFLNYAKQHPELLFMITKVGCGLAGYSNDEIAPMFMDAPSNCVFDSDWEYILGKDRDYFRY